MYGLEAIAASNGWAIAVVGITIVFTGIVLLSLIISQLHKIIDMIENSGKNGFFKKKQKPEVKAAPKTVFTETQKESAKQFRLLTRTMADHFPLPRLLHLAEISGIEKPYDSLNTLLESSIIVPDGTGYFTWDKERFEKAVFQKK